MIRSETLAKSLAQCLVGESLAGSLGSDHTCMHDSQRDSLRDSLFFTRGVTYCQTHKQTTSLNLRYRAVLFFDFSKVPRRKGSTPYFRFATICHLLLTASTWNFPLRFSKIHLRFMFLPANVSHCLYTERKPYVAITKPKHRVKRVHSISQTTVSKNLWPLNALIFQVASSVVGSPTTCEV